MKNKYSRIVLLMFYKYPMEFIKINAEGDENTYRTILQAFLW